MTRPVDWTTFLFGGIVGAILGAAVGAWIGHILATRREQHLRAIDEAAARSEAAISLMREITRLRAKLKRDFPKSVALVAWDQPIELLPFQVYDELRSVGRIVSLGPKIAPSVNLFYERIERINGLLGELRGEAASVRDERVDPEAQFGPLWEKIWLARSESLRIARTTVRLLRIAGTGRASS